MEQMIEKGYADKYMGSTKTIYLAAFAFLGKGDIKMLIQAKQPKTEKPNPEETN